ncbi:MAG: hypothetical protein ACJ757_00490 [Gaiellaceae bacterium]
MTEALDPLGPDWGDVVHRSRRALRRRRALNGAALLAVVAAGVASAYALGHPVIDFGQAQHGSLKQVNEFGSMEVGAPRGMAPGVLPHQTRRIAVVRIDGKVHTLYVAPTKQGGFCALWSNLGGGCRADRHDKFASHLDAGGLVGRGGLVVLQGSFFQARGDRLTMSFKDGATADVPFVWVTAPIDAGFYLYRIPNAHRHASTRAVSLALYDKDGKLLAREPVIAPQRMPDGVTHRVKGFPPLQVPAEAIWAKRTRLFDERTADGARLGLWIAPRRGGGTCMWTNNSLGCHPAGSTRDRNIGPLATLGFLNGGKHVHLCCGVGGGITRVEALFQDGDRVELTPKRGYLLWPIPPAHWTLGHRIVSLVGYDSAGRVVASHALPKPADQRALYYCTKPKSLGYGVKLCP